MVDAEKGAPGRRPATAAQLEQRISTLITNGARDGHITSTKRLTQDLGKQLIARYAPDLSALLTQRKSQATAAQ